jgi:outer membrane protein assembly factor BamB
MTDIDQISETPAARPEPRLRLWPALLIVAVHLSVSLYTLYFGATNTQSMVGFIGAPIVALLLLTVWWLAASRAPWRSRLVGLLMTAVALLCTFAIQGANGQFHLLFTIPVMTTVLVAALAVTSRMSWRLRRWVLAGVLVACTLGVNALRAEGLSSSLTPVLAWCWSPTAAELLHAAPAAEAGGTAVLPAQTGPGDWPAFRGPDRDNRVAGVKFSSDWSTPPRELWRKRIGLGWSSYAAVGDYIFTLEQRDQEELVTCSRADTGADVWVNRTKTHYDNDMGGSGPRATPTFDQGRLYTLGATGTLQCLDAATGKAVWTRDIKADAETGVPGWGFSSSPLVVGGRLLVFTNAGDGKSVIAYELQSGNPVWRAGHGGGGYSSPQLSVLCDTPQVLMAGEFGLWSLVPETGQLLWERAVAKEMNPRCAQPLLAEGNTVMLGSPAGAGARMFQIQKKDTAWSVEEKWASRKYRPYFNDSVFFKGHAYGFDGDRLACLDTATGEMCWQGKRHGGQVLLLPDMEMLLVVSEKGEAILIPATPTEYKEVARFKALNGKTWNHPTIAHGKLFVRNAEEAACFELPMVQ